LTPCLLGQIIQALPDGLGVPEGTASIRGCAVGCVLRRRGNMRFPAGRLFLVCLVGVTLSGCFAVTRSYVDPGLPKASYSDLRPRADPQPLYLTVEFLTHEKPNPQGSALVFEKARKILLASRLFSSVASAAGERSDHLAIVMQNVGDTAEAGRRGAVTGLTFGLAGSLVTDGYVVTATYTRVGKESQFRKDYVHAIHSSVGLQKGPEGLPPMSLSEAFDKVVEDLVLNVLRDLQQGGYL